MRRRNVIRIEIVFEDVMHVVGRQEAYIIFAPDLDQPVVDRLEFVNGVAL